MILSINKKEAFSSRKKRLEQSAPIEQSLFLNRCGKGGGHPFLIGEAGYWHFDRNFPVGGEPGSQPLDFGKLIIKEVAAGK